MQHLIEQELSATAAAWKVGKDGKARVCARRAVALTSEGWAARRSVHARHMDAMAHLRRIHEDEFVPQSVLPEAERLTTDRHA